MKEYMTIELWCENELFKITCIDFDPISASEKIMNAARKHGITIWF